MMKTVQALSLIVATIWTTTTIAHEGMGPHGGRLADTGTHHLELVMTKDGVQVFVSTKASEPVPASKLSGLAIVIANGALTRIPLAAAGDDKLTGEATTSLPDHARSVVRVTLADGQTIQASFD